MTLLRYSFIIVLFSAFFFFQAEAQEDIYSKKFIHLGWDIPNTAYLKEHHAEMQRTTPFDGVMLALEATAPDGKRYSSQEMMDTQPWEPAWFTAAIEDLKACQWTTFTDNFLRVNFTPGQIDWHDDNGWTIFCNKTALCAKIAKETGLKGFAVDFEPYGRAVFKYAADSGHSFDEMKRIVRQRGKQWLEAIAAEYPDMILFTLFIADVNLSAGYERRPDAALQLLHYGLLPSFFNGMLDAAPPEMRIIDGNETGYYKNGLDEFTRLALAIQSIGGPAIRLVAPENRQKYINQVQVGFGFYLDMYTNPEGNVYYRGPKEGGTRLDRLEENLSAAWGTTDEYVWIYGEQRRWWKPANPEAQWEHWDEAMPGMSRAIRFIKNPLEAAKQEIEVRQKEERLVNLLRNPDFAESTADWSFWQDKPLGTCSWDDDTARLSKVEWGCILQSVQPVKPDESYYVAIDGRQEGAGQIDVSIGWADAEGNWLWSLATRVLPLEEEPDRIDGRERPNGWLRAEGIVKIPEGVAEMRVMAGVKGQSTDADSVWFDNAVLIRLR